MSGNEYLEKMNYANHGFAEGAALNPNARVIKTQWKDQLKGDPILVGRPSNTALTFAKLENANIPRKYTGKVAKGLLKKLETYTKSASTAGEAYPGLLTGGPWNTFHAMSAASVKAGVGPITTGHDAFRTYDDQYKKWVNAGGSKTEASYFLGNY
jgi:hypothetical protein